MVHYNTDSTGTVINQSLCFRTKGKIVYREYLSEDILTVDGEKLQLGDLAMYIAYEELKVEDEAAAYDYYDTNKYWNLHTSGRFVKEVAKDPCHRNGST